MRGPSVLLHQQEHKKQKKQNNLKQIYQGLANLRLEVEVDVEVADSA